MKRRTKVAISLAPVLVVLFMFLVPLPVLAIRCIGLPPLCTPGQVLDYESPISALTGSHVGADYLLPGAACGGIGPCQHPGDAVYVIEWWPGLVFKAWL